MAVKAGKAAVQITADTSGFWSGLKAAGQGLRSFATAAQAELQRMGPIFSAMGASIAGGLAVALRYGAGAQETIQRFNALFGEQAEEMGKWATEYAKVLGLGSGDVMGLLSTAQGMAVNLGLANDQAAALSSTLVTLASDMAATFGGTEESMLAVLQQGLAGSTRSLKRYGIAIDDTVLQQTALEMGIGKSVREMTEQEKVMVKLNAIVKGSSEMQGAAGRVSNLWNRQMRALRSTLVDIAEEVGMKLIPILMPYVQMMRNAMSNTLEWVAANDTLVPGLVALAQMLMLIGGTLTFIGVAIAAAFSPALGATILWAALLGGMAYAALRFFGVIDDGMLATVGNMEIAGQTISTWWDSLVNWLLGKWLIFVGGFWTSIDFVAKLFKSFGQIGIYLYNSIHAALLRVQASFTDIFDGLYDYMLQWIFKGQKAWLDFQAGSGAISAEEYARRWAQMNTDRSRARKDAESRQGADQSRNMAAALERVNAEMKFWPEQSYGWIQGSLDLINNELTRTEKRQGKLPGIGDLTGWISNLFTGSNITIPKVTMPNVDLGGLGPEVPRMPDDARAGGGTRGAFGGAIAEAMGGAGGVAQQQLGEMKRQTSLLQQINTGISDMEATYG